MIKSVSSSREKKKLWNKKETYAFNIGINPFIQHNILRTSESKKLDKGGCILKLCPVLYG